MVMGTFLLGLGIATGEEGSKSSLAVEGGGAEDTESVGPSPSDERVDASALLVEGIPPSSPLTAAAFVRRLLFLGFRLGSI
jgi:hypothetical protein